MRKKQIVFTLMLMVMVAAFSVPGKISTSGKVHQLMVQTDPPPPPPPRCIPITGGGFWCVGAPSIAGSGS
jgi:hypothetical protein